jgi:hypothetical protein
MPLFIQIYLFFSVVLISLNLFIGAFNLDVKFKFCCEGLVLLDVLWAVYTLVCIIIIAFIH